MNPTAKFMDLLDAIEANDRQAALGWEDFCLLASQYRKLQQQTERLEDQLHAFKLRIEAVMEDF